MRIKDLKPGVVYWARNLRRADASELGLESVILCADFDVPVLDRVHYKGAKTKKLLPYTYVGEELIASTRKHNRTVLYKFLHRGKLLYAPGKIIASFFDLDAENVMSRLAIRLGELSYSEQLVINQMVDPNTPAHELLVIDPGFEHRRFILVPRTAKGRRDALNNILDRVSRGAISTFEYFSREGERIRLRVKNTQIAKMNK